MPIWKEEGKDETRCNCNIISRFPVGEILITNFYYRVSVYILHINVARIFMFYADADRGSMDSTAETTLINPVAFISWHYYENCGLLSRLRSARNWEIFMKSCCIAHITYLLRSGIFTGLLWLIQTPDFGSNVACLYTIIIAYMRM